MKIVLTSRGSRGDVQPIIEVASALQSKGHQTVICVPDLFRDEITRLNLSASFYPEDSKELMIGLGSGLGSTRQALAFFSRSIEEQFQFMLEATKDADILVTSVNEMAAPTIAEIRHIPYFRIGFAPILPGNQPPPLFPWQNMPGMANSLAWSAINSMAGVLIRKFINRKRKEFGLKAAPGTNRYFTGRSHTLLAINETLGPPCDSWYNRYRFNYTGYCYSPPVGGLDQSLLDFIEEGVPPVYIGFGSVTMKDPNHLAAIIKEAVDRSGIRVVLGHGWTGLKPGQQHKQIYSVGDTCHQSLFPKMAGIVHHGGSGTVHTAAKAGIPQFILPQIIDQYYWGNRIHKLGLGPAPVIPKRITAKILMNVLSDFTQKGHFRDKSKALAKSMEEENGVENAVKFITLPSEYPVISLFSSRKSNRTSNHVAC